MLKIRKLLLVAKSEHKKIMLHQASLFTYWHSKLGQKGRLTLSLTAIFGPFSNGQ